MRLKPDFFLPIVLLSVCSSAAFASGDFGCLPPRGNTFLRKFNACISLPFLSPANDSRLNLELLLIDQGKLTGALAIPPDKLALKEPALLSVPFDLGNWDVHEPKPDAGMKIMSAGVPATSNEYAQGEGSRCRSANAGLEAFTNAVKTATALPADDASILISARSSLVADCSSVSVPEWKSPAVHSSLGQEFETYIAAAHAFYAGEFPAALGGFNQLKGSSNPWLHETSGYMVGRTLLNSSQQKAFGEWGQLQFGNVNKDDLRQADSAFQDYLRDFPKGLYAASAQGLLRRIYWLAGDQTHLAEAYDRAFGDVAKGASNVSLLDLVQEVDMKLLNTAQIDQIKSPQLLAIVDLRLMRSTSEQETGAVENSDLSLAQLEEQKNRFAGEPGLHNYLLAAYHLYVDDKPGQAIPLLPDLHGARLDYFAFSEQMMRVAALERSQRDEEARQLLLQLMPVARLPLQVEAVQLELARYDEHTGHLDRVFAPKSPVQDKAIRTILAEHAASPELLRQRIKDPRENADVLEAALYSLLYKELTGAKYEAFQSDVMLLPAQPSEILAPFAASTGKKNGDYECPSIHDVAATLQVKKDDGRSLNCVGEFIRLHGVHYDQGKTPPVNDLGGARTSFPATNYSRMDGYLNVIGNGSANGDARAYALFRAIRCFAPAGYNECGEQKIEPATRKLWFQTLHKDYAESTWAKSLKYYW